MGTYGQLIRALDMDRRAEEAHAIWRKKIGHDLHSVPWQLCLQMTRIYFRNNMLQELVKVCLLDDLQFWLGLIPSFVVPSPLLISNLCLF